MAYLDKIALDHTILQSHPHCLNDFLTSWMQQCRTPHDKHLINLKATWGMKVTAFWKSWSMMVMASWLWMMALGCWSWFSPPSFIQSSCCFACSPWLGTWATRRLRVASWNTARGREKRPQHILGNSWQFTNIMSWDWKEWLFGYVWDGWKIIDEDVWGCDSHKSGVTTTCETTTG